MAESVYLCKVDKTKHLPLINNVFVEGKRDHDLNEHAYITFNTAFTHS